jgi:hypothetical protein
MCHLGTYKVKFENEAGSDESSGKVSIKPVKPFFSRQSSNDFRAKFRLIFAPNFDWFSRQIKKKLFSAILK